MSKRPTLAQLNPDDHVFRTTYGLEATLAPALKAKMGALILSIAGADGELSERELATHAGLGHSMAPSDVVEATVKSASAPRRIEELVDDELRPLARFVLHDAIRISRTDGFDRKERAAAMRAAAKLGLDPDLVLAIEAYFHVEDAVRTARLTFLHGEAPDPSRLARVPPGRPARGSDLSYYRRDQHGVDGPVAAALDRKIGSAILCIVGADGELTNREWAYFVGHERALMVPPELLVECLMFDFQTARIESFLDDATRPYARVILFDALRVASADGFSENERDMARRGAVALGEDTSIVAALEGQLLLEDALLKARMRLLSPS